MEYDISDPTLVDLTSNFFVLCTSVKVIYIIIHSGWSLALIFIKIGLNHCQMKKILCSSHMVYIMLFIESQSFKILKFKILEIINFYPASQ